MPQRIRLGNGNMGIRYTQETIWEEEAPTVLEWEDECRWKTMDYLDPNQQYGDDIDDPLEKSTYPD